MGIKPMKEAHTCQASNWNFLAAARDLRTERHWRGLLESVGLRVVDIRNPTREENESAGVIEVLLANYSGIM